MAPYNATRCNATGLSTIALTSYVRYSDPVAVSTCVALFTGERGVGAVEFGSMGLHGEA